MDSSGKNRLIASTLSDGSVMSEFQTPEVDKNEIRTEEKIGGGCFGNVYKGNVRGKIVAVKKLHAQSLDDATLEEFRKEVEIMTHLRHPNIVLFMGACTEAGHLAIVTELLPNGSLHDLIHNPKIEISLLQKVKMLKDIALGMNWLHCSKPSIIHRDLKPTNVLVDENWNLKICDFGLSAVKRSEKVQDNGVAPGTPLWMSPEVLRGKPLNEKADIYSFAIVCWEILTRLEPFENHDSYNNFVRAVCDNKERPPIPEGTHESLIKLMTACWNEDADLRPNFATIISLLDEAMIQIAISDADSRNFWKKLVGTGNKDRAVFADFAKRLWHDLGMSSPDVLSSRYKCLAAILAHHSKREENDVVTLEKFSLFLDWFGPIMKKDPIHGTIVDLVESICSKEYFHGDISRQESEQKLANTKKGTFLLRLSTTEPTATPFTISKVNREGVVIHQRVHVTANHSGFVLVIKSPEPKRIECQGPITELILKAAKDISLKQACVGSKFATIFTSEDKIGGYQDE